MFRFFAFFVTIMTPKPPIIFIKPFGSNGFEVPAWDF